MAKNGMAKKLLLGVKLAIFLDFSVVGAAVVSFAWECLKIVALY